MRCIKLYVAVPRVSYTRVWPCCWGLVRRDAISLFHGEALNML